MISKNNLPIIVQPTGGLCNRMRTIVSAAELAEMMGRKILVVWTSDVSLNASFVSLFEHLPFRVVDVKLGSVCQRSIWHVCKMLGYRFYDDQWIYANARGKPFDEWLPQMKMTTPYIVSSCDIIKNHGDYGMFAISCGLRKYLIHHDGEDMIGIHIRRADNDMSIRYSPTRLFVERMRDELRKVPQVKFYLATDDPDEEKTLYRMFPDNIVVYKKQSLDRNNPLAIKDAVIDLANLASCSKIYGSYWSSFSDVAALWGGIEKVVLKVSEETDNE